MKKKYNAPKMEEIKIAQRVNLLTASVQVGFVGWIDDGDEGADNN